MESGAGEGAAHGLNAGKDGLDVGSARQVVVRVVVLVVEEVDVDAVGVVLGADGRDGGEGGGCFMPGAAGHAAGVVDQEDGVELGEERVAVVVGSRDGRGVRWRRFRRRPAPSGTYGVAFCGEYGAR